MRLKTPNSVRRQTQNTSTSRSAVFPVVAACVALLAASAFSQVSISGSISDGSGGPLLTGTTYHVTGSLAVPTSLTLTIQPGAILKFDASLIMTVNGTLVCGSGAGTTYFTSSQDETIGVDVTPTTTTGAAFLSVGYLLYKTTHPAAVAALALLQGILILDFLILLHEVVHGLVGARRSTIFDTVLGFLYALPAGISASQYTRWHLDHHRELGSDTTDPKRAYLTPRRVARWYKFLYCTPMLFFFYARASARAARAYSPALRRRIRVEKTLALAVHLIFATALASHSFGALMRVYLLPLFVCFPPAFVINRLGQHYDIDRTRVEAWSTLVNGNKLIRGLYLWSNHHIEHHYFPDVPFYRLGRLNRMLQPFFTREGIHSRSYTGLLVDWFIRNRPPHTAWKKSEF